MKIMIIMAGYFPGKKYGGPPVSVSNFCSLMQEYECYVVTTNHDLGERQTYENITKGWNERENCKVRYLSDDEYNIKAFENLMYEITPDIIYLQGLFQKCILPCLYLAKKIKINVVIAPRGELCEGALKIKKYKKIPYIVVLNIAGLVKNVIFQSTSTEESEAIHKYLKMDYKDIYLLENIPSIPSEKFERNVKKIGEGRFVFLSRIHPKKNLLSAIDCFRYVEGYVVFDIYGPIEDELYWEQCQEAINRLPNNILVTYKGLVSHDEVHKIFSQYDAFVFPTFSENYGHVIAEALMVKTPVIISNQTPWTDIMEYGGGFAYSLNDKRKFVDAIQKMVDSDSAEFTYVQSRVDAYMKKKLQLDNLKCSYKKLFSVIDERL